MADPAAVAGHTPMKLHEHAKAVTGDVLEPATVHDDLSEPHIHELLDVADELLGGLGVQPPVGLDDQDVTVDIVVVQLHSGRMVPDIAYHARTRPTRLRHGFDVPDISHLTFARR